MGSGSVIRKNPFRIPDPAVKKALDPESGPATLESKLKKVPDAEHNASRSSI
jgi:hypothetical protein